MSVLRLLAVDLKISAVFTNLRQHPSLKLRLSGGYGGQGASDAVLNGVSEKLFMSGLCLPSGSGLEVAQVERVCGVVRDALG